MNNVLDITWKNICNKIRDYNKFTEEDVRKIESIKGVPILAVFERKNVGGTSSFAAFLDTADAAPGGLLEYPKVSLKRCSSVSIHDVARKINFYRLVFDRGGRTGLYDSINCIAIRARDNGWIDNGAYRIIVDVLSRGRRELDRDFATTATTNTNNIW